MLRTRMVFFYKRTDMKTFQNLAVRDLIQYKDGDQSKVLAVCGEAFLKSWRDDFDTAHTWFTFKEAEKYGWSIVQPKEGAWVPTCGDLFFHITSEEKLALSRW